MDLADLNIFRAVVEAGGITRAAEKLHRVQSNVTTRVRQLEQDLGVDLFVREGKRLHLSPAGKLLLNYADQLLDLAHEAREAVHDVKPRGIFRLGSIESTAAIRLPGPLNEYHHRYPDVTLELQTGNTFELPAKVLRGELDAALVSEPVADAPFEKVQVYDEELALVACARHPPIKSPRDLQPQTILAFHPGCSYRLRLEQWFAQSGEMPERIVEMTSWHAILGCTAAGMGVVGPAENGSVHFPGPEIAQRSSSAGKSVARTHRADLAQGHAIAEGERLAGGVEGAIRMARSRCSSAASAARASSTRSARAQIV